MSQRLIYKQITTNEGLPSETVFDVLEDEAGFIWVATMNGLARWDGFRFETFESKLATPSLTWIKMGPDGRIYGYSFDEKIVVLSGNEVVPFLPEKIGPIPIPVNENFIFLTDGRLAIFNNTSLILVDLMSEEVSKIEIKESSELFPFHTLIQLTETELLLINRFTGHLINLETEEYTLSSLDLKLGLPYDETTTVKFKLENFHGRTVLLIQTRLDVDVYEYVNRKWVSHELTSWFAGRKIDVLSILSEVPDEYIVSSYSGVIRLSRLPDGSFNEESIIDDLSVNRFIRDRESGYWASTVNKGLFYFRSLEMRAWDRYTLGFEDVPLYNVVYGSDEILVGNGMGEVGRMDLNSGAWTWYDIGERRYVETIHYIPDSRFLLVSCGGLKQLNLETSEYLLLTLSSVKDMKLLHNGDIMGATHAYSFILSNREEIDYPYIDRLELPEGAIFKYEYRLRMGRSMKVWQHPIDLSLWVSYRDGLHRHDAETVRQFLKDEEQVFATSFAMKSDLTMLIGTRVNGLLTIDPSGNTEALTTENGLLSMSISEILVHGDSVWVGTNRGVQLLDTEFRPVVNLSLTSGLISSEVNGMTLHRRNLYIVGSNGLQEIPVSLAYRETTPPHIGIHTVKISGNRVDHSKQHRLSGEDFPIDIEFTGLSYRSGNALRYRYRLTGLQLDWNYSDAYNNTAQFFGLPAGGYVFEVYAISSDGVPSEKAATFSFYVEPPYWQTAWFWILLLIIFGGTFYGIVVYRESVIRSEATLRMEKENLASELRISQLSAIKAQMNPHFIFNALNSIQTFVFKNDRVSANTYLGKFSDLMRMILKLSNEPSISLDDEIKALRLYLDLESVRFKENFHFHIDIEEDLETDQIRIPSMLIQPYVENAVKHGLLHKGGQGHVWIRIKRHEKDPLLLVEIEDDGVGRKKSEEIQLRKERSFGSFATGANNKRLELLNSGAEKTIGAEIEDKYDQRGHSLGTKVKLSIPITY